MGYKLAGFNVLGVDIKPQPRYPGWFVWADALEFAREYGHLFDLIHASPPCQNYSVASIPAKRQGKTYPDLIAPVRDLLLTTGKPYVIENVPLAPLENPLMLCGTMFNLMVIRHRLFETSPPIWFAPAPCRHWTKTIKQGRRPKRGEEFHCVTGHFSDIDYARSSMGVPWMGPQKELAESIPPAYTRYIGEQMMRVVVRDV